MFELPSVVICFADFRMIGDHGQFEHSEIFYFSHLNLIAKVQGVDVAEKYMKNVPNSFRGE